jgi:hypothetical protein
MIWMPASYLRLWRRDCLVIVLTLTYFKGHLRSLLSWLEMATRKAVTKMKVMACPPLWEVTKMKFTVVEMAVDTLAESVHQSHVGLAGDGDPRTYVGLLTKNVIYRRLLACNMHCTVSPLLLFINRIWSF